MSGRTGIQGLGPARGRLRLPGREKPGRPHPLGDDRQDPQDDPGVAVTHAPDSPDLLALAQEYGADKDRFEKEASFCIHCGLCVRYCAEVKKAHAVGFVDRGIRKEISFVPNIAARECWNCKECFELCPTKALQAAYVLTKALLPHPPSFEPADQK